MGVVSEILALFHIVDRFEEKKNANKETPASRFVAVFESHGIHRNQIPRYLPDVLTLANVQSDKALTTVLNQKMIDRVSDLFRVNADWIECASSNPYQPFDFYKQPQKFVEFIEDLLTSGSDLCGVVFTSAAPGSGHHADTFILLEETFDIAPELPLTRYYILDNWFFNYGKSRAYLIACVAAAWKKDVYIHGRKVSKELVRKYEFGEKLLEPDVTDHWPGAHWHPEDMALDPKKLIEGLPTSHDKQMAVDILIDLFETDRRFSLAKKESIFRGCSFAEMLQTLKGQE